MEIKIDTKALYKVLSGLIKAVPAKSPLPILDNYLVTVKNGVLMMTASDTEMAVTAQIPTIDVKGDASFAVPAKILTDLSAKMTEGEIVMEHTPGDMTVTCRWESGKSIMPVFDAMDFPERTAADEDSETIIFSQAFLKDALSKTIPVMDQESYRPALVSVYFDIRPDGTSIVASDTHVLTCVDCNTTGEKPFLLPAKAATMLKSMLEKDGDVQIKHDGQNAVITFGQYAISTALVNASYPNYANVIPKNNPNVLSVKKELLSAVIKRMLTCTNKASKRVRIKLTYNEACISGEDIGFSISATETLMCDYDGDDMDIGFNGASLIKILDTISSENIEIHFLTSNKASLLMPSEDDRKNEPIRCVIMPTMVA